MPGDAPSQLGIVPHPLTADRDWWLGSERAGFGLLLFPVKVLLPQQPALKQGGKGVVGREWKQPESSSWSVECVTGKASVLPRNGMTEMVVLHQPGMIW